VLIITDFRFIEHLLEVVNSPTDFLFDTVCVVFLEIRFSDSSFVIAALLPCIKFLQQTEVSQRLLEILEKVYSFIDSMAYGTRRLNAAFTRVLQ
jgi:hypothetical protein